MKKRRERRMTAGELLRQLESDPEWVRKRDERERLRAQDVAQLSAAARPLVQDLRDVGIAVSSVWDLVNTSARYPTAIPVLLDHLRRPYPDEISAGIARALAVPDARPHWRALVAEYEATNSAQMPHKKDGLAIAVAKTSDLGEVMRLITNPAHGDSRLFLLLALKGSADRDVLITLKDLTRDPLFSKEIASWRQTDRLSS